MKADRGVGVEPIHESIVDKNRQLGKKYKELLLLSIVPAAL